MDDSWLAVFDPSAQHAFFAEALLESPTYQAAFCPRLAWFLSECTRLSYLDDSEQQAAVLHKHGAILVQSFHCDDLAAGLWQWPDCQILVYRGTHRNRNWLRNLRIAPIPYKIANQRCKVHAGFFRAFQKLDAQIAAQLQTQKPLLCCGHSLGAAIATLAGHAYRAQVVYSFGSPRLGDKHFCQAYPVTLHRMCCVDDIVTRLPSSHGPSIYQHIGEAIYLGEKQRKRDRFKMKLRQPELFLKSPKHLSDHAPINYSQRLAELNQSS